MVLTLRVAFWQWCPGGSLCQREVTCWHRKSDNVQIVTLWGLKLHRPSKASGLRLGIWMCVSGMKEENEALGEKHRLDSQVYVCTE